MPPHIELDSSHDEWRTTRQPQLASLNLANGEQSPLFQDEDNTRQSSFNSLDRRQSDTEFVWTARQLVKKDKKNNQEVKPFVSKISMIIGPESAYVKGGDPPVTIRTMQQSSTSWDNHHQQKNEQLDDDDRTRDSKVRRPMMVRVTRHVSQKGWRVVKYIGGSGSKFVTSVVNTKILSSRS